MSTDSTVRRRKPLVPRLLEEAEKRAPEKYRPYVKKISPIVLGLANFADAAAPYVIQAFRVLVALYKLIEPYNPHQFLPLAFGLVMCFFGGSFLTLVAAAEAVRLTVWNRLWKAFKILYDNAQAAKEASAKDDTLDEDNDGIADVDQVSNQELFTRKIYVVLRTVDPDLCMDALSAVWGGFLSILATLRIHFAQCVTLGCSLGEMAMTAVGKNVQDFFTDVMPKDLKKWAPRLTQQIFIFAGVFLAWCLQTIIASFHSAIRGGTMAVRSGIQLAKAKGYLDPTFDEESKEVNAAAMVLGGFGFIWQFRNGFAVPFPLNLVLFPVIFIEWMLSTCLVASAVV